MVFGLFDAPRPFKGQQYSKLKKQAQESGHPFIDTEFPPDDKSLFYSKGKLAGVVWKRPRDICENPQLFVEGVDRGDVHQGRLGNCWFVAACSCLTLYKEVWHKVIPNHKEQEWNPEKPENYCGIFHFQFWRYGEWIDIVIDDFLPTLNGELVFVHSQSKNEFWSAFLEKAYAKLFGCYEALDGGDLAEALVDFTGGVAEPIDIVESKIREDEEQRNELFTVLDKEMDHKSLMAASIPAKSADEMEAHTDMGLVKGHAYGITAVKKVALAGTGLFNLFNQEKIKMVRLRNPWGEGEWKGAFSDGYDDGSKEWEKISARDREKIGLTFDDDGEFWMTFEDFCLHFYNLSICRTVNTSFFSIRKTWREAVHHGQWKKPQLAGGCLNNRDTFLNNPQYLFEVSGEEDEILISVMQKASRGQGPDAQKLVIGFTILKVDLNRQYRVHRLVDVVKSSPFKNSRSIFLRYTLEKGRYVVIPCTFDAGLEGNFLLRIYTTHAHQSKELIQDKPSKNVCICIKYPQAVSRIQVIKATGLEKQDTRGGADPYCIIECEGHKATTKVCNDTLNPFWKQSAVFYRKSPLKSPITVTIWNKNPVMDEFMGRQVFTSTEDKEGMVQEVSLMGKNKEKDPIRPGHLFVEIATKTDLVNL